MATMMAPMALRRGIMTSVWPASGSVGSAPLAALKSTRPNVRMFTKGYELAPPDMDEAKRWKKGVDLTFEEVERLARAPTFDTVLLDVREKIETRGGMIPSALNVPLSELMSALQLHPSVFQKEYGFPRPSEDTRIATYCRSGKRSATARDLLMARGYDSRSYTGSWLEWQVKHLDDEED